jgi:mRNA interferase RelE/StbE
MRYRLTYSEKALKQLSKLNKQVSKVIINYLDKYVDNSTIPYQHAKRLKGKLGKYWRYRIGDYRVICDIQDDVLIVEVVYIDHRKSVYNFTI